MRLTGFIYELLEQYGCSTMEELIKKHGKAEILYKENGELFQIDEIDTDSETIVIY